MCTAVMKWILPILVAAITTELVVEIRKKIRTRSGFEPNDLCDTGAALYQLRYLAN